MKLDNMISRLRPEFANRIPTTQAEAEEQASYAAQYCLQVLGDSPVRIGKVVSGLGFGCRCHRCALQWEWFLFLGAAVYVRRIDWWLSKLVARVSYNKYLEYVYNTARKKSPMTITDCGDSRGGFLCLRAYPTHGPVP